MTTNEPSNPLPSIEGAGIPCDYLQAWIHTGDESEWCFLCTEVLPLFGSGMIRLKTIKSGTKGHVPKVPHEFGGYVWIGPSALQALVPQLSPTEENPEC